MTDLNALSTSLRDALEVVEEVIAATTRPGDEPARERPPFRPGESTYLTALMDEIHTERIRANEAHGISSMEATKWWHGRRLAILMEETGEVARAYNERDHRRLGIDHPQFMAELRGELVQVAAMAVGWLAGIDGYPLPMVLTDEYPPTE